MLVTDSSYVQLYIQSTSSYCYNKVKIVLFNVSVKDNSVKYSKQYSLTVGLQGCNHCTFNIIYI